MEKAFKLDFVNDKTGSLYVNCCGCSQTAPLHSFGPASKPHYLIHYVLSGKGHFRFHDKEYRLEQAAVELVRSAKPITQIAQNAGYDNASKFSEAFRKRYGTTPSQYRTHANGLAKRSREIRME